MDHRVSLVLDSKILELVRLILWRANKVSKVSVMERVLEMRESRTLVKRDAC